ncbi:ABC transporter permease [Pseudaminobacter soli (ex Li et al. 2025)]|uniref:ABC transporter permease n=1 Tax=Pseudaminobacter soli (ex Li et al. 2025) TaxID=1295366 RepID=A0A2P7SN56_9HYPH|nr:ABC transporter permease [Mesorhizobium soli]PSJ63919.1 ABC transporter permease [Mesorhizobium soli]
MESSIWTLLSWGPEGWSRSIAYGVFTTVSLALATLPLGLFIGFLIALAKQSSEPSLRLAGNIYTTIFRGLPELLTLFLVFYGAQLGIQQVARIFDPNAAIEINSFVAGMVALGVMFSSYASEVFLSAFRAIPIGQYEGGYSIGLTKRQTMRLVVFPQLIRIALPGLSNLWLILLKDTALVSVIGLSDILRQATIASRVTKESFLFFGVACLAYLVLAILSSFGIGAIERAVGKTEMHR